MAREKHHFTHHSWISPCLHITELRVHIQRSLLSSISQKKAEFSIPTPQVHPAAHTNKVVQDTLVLYLCTGRVGLFVCLFFTLIISSVENM